MPEPRDADGNDGGAKEFPLLCPNAGSFVSGAAVNPPKPEDSPVPVGEENDPKPDGLSRSPVLLSEVWGSGLGLLPKLKEPAPAGAPPKDSGAVLPLVTAEVGKAGPTEEETCSVWEDGTPNVPGPTTPLPKVDPNAPVLLLVLLPDAVPAVLFANDGPTPKLLAFEPADENIDVGAVSFPLPGVCCDMCAPCPPNAEPWEVLKMPAVDTGTPCPPNTEPWEVLKTPAVPNVGAVELRGSAGPNCWGEGLAASKGLGCTCFAPPEKQSRQNSQNSQ